jgi:hypothetical protein
MDGNLAALNEHLASLDAEDYEQEWKAGYIDDCVEAAMFQLETQSYFMHNGNLYSLLDVFCDASLNAQMGIGDALKMLMFKEGAEVYSADLEAWAREELADWVDADDAYDRHVSVNEPQEY